MKYVILCISLVIINSIFFIVYNTKKPKEIIKTVIETKEVVKYVYKKDTTQIDRVIRKNHIDGTSTTVVERIRNKSNMVSKSKEKKDISISKSITTSLPSYHFSVLIPIITESPNYYNLQFIGGIRLITFPIFLNLGANFKLDSFTVGTTIEF
jgi:hypothetical protein